MALVAIRSVCLVLSATVLLFQQAASHPSTGVATRLISHQLVTPEEYGIQPGAQEPFVVRARHATLLACMRARRLGISSKRYSG